MRAATGQYWIQSAASPIVACCFLQQKNARSFFLLNHFGNSTIVVFLSLRSVSFIPSGIPLCTECDYSDESKFAGDRKGNIC